MRKGIVFVVLAVVVVAGAVYMALDNQSPGRLEAAGTIEATQVDVSTQVGGALVSVDVEAGDKVEKGDLLARTDESILKDKVAQAQALVDKADAVLTQAKNGPTLQKEIAQADVSATQAGLNIAQAQLDFSTVKAPIGGDVLSVPFSAGENLAPGATLAVLADLDDLRVTVYVPEGRLGRVKIGRQARISIDSVKTDFTGRVIHIAQEPEFTPTNIETKDQRIKQVFAVTLKVKNRRGLLKPGMPADVDFKL